MRQAITGPATAAPSFDVAPGARPLFKERALWVAVMGLFFFMAYGGANEIAALTAPHPELFMGWERAIPFVPAFILPYMSSDILFVAAFFAASDRVSLQQLALRCGLAIALSAAVFLAFP
ncbi:MAG: serine/threonine protein phosphatase, partial [Pseudomonadota bacterium]